MSDFPVADAKDISVKLNGTDTTVQNAINSMGGGFVVESLPTADVDHYGQVYQYVGADTDDYKKGYFYLCTTNDDAEYVWVEKDVQKAGDSSWTGTKAEWNALTVQQKADYTTVYFTDDTEIPTLEKDVYSTEETLTNKVWIDGKPIYRRVYTGLEFGAVANAWSLVYSGLPPITDADTLIYGVALRVGSESTSAVVNEFSFLFSADKQIKYYCTTTFTKCNQLIIEYTKTTDTTE